MCLSDVWPAVLHIYNGSLTSAEDSCFNLVISLTQPLCCLSGGVQPKLKGCFNESVIMVLFKN